MSDIMLKNLSNLLLGKWGNSRKNIFSYLEKNSLKNAHNLEISQYRSLVTSELKNLATTNFSALTFSKNVGGFADLAAGLVSLETLAFGDISLMVKAGVQWGLFGGSIATLGNEQQQKQYLPEIISGKLLGCFAMTETKHGSDVSSIETTASYDCMREEFIIRTPNILASKNYIGNAACDAELAIVFAQLFTGGGDHGVHAFLVPIRDKKGQILPNVTIEDCGKKNGLNGVDNGRISFDSVRVSRNALLSKFGQVATDGVYTSSIANNNRRFFTMLNTLIRGRITVAGAAGSCTKKALNIAINYSLVRKQFFDDKNNEVILLDYVTHQKRLLLPLAKTYALHFAQDSLIKEFVANNDSLETAVLSQRELETCAAGLKAIATWHATETIQQCREACGAAGYLDSGLLGVLKADTDIFTTFEGDNTVLLELVGKNLLKSYTKNLGNFGAAKLFAEQVGEVVSERSVLRQLATRFTDVKRTKQNEQGIMDRNWHISLFAERQKHTIESLLQRVRSTKKKNSFEHFNKVTPHLLFASKAYLENFIFNAFIEKIVTTEDAEIAILLHDLCDLYVLGELEKNSSWFLEHDRISPAQSKAISDGIYVLCKKLRPKAKMLVEAFKIPDICVSATFLQEENN